METGPIPNPRAGEVLIRVKASGSAAPSCSPDRAIHPTFGFDFLLGIEAVRLVEEADVGGIQSGHAVVSL
jgi:NADPH:quinone reductase-like Zn-dependent oxidoreductase